MELNPVVWGPHYWFVLESIALTYPLHPNEVAKKKYYDFICNLPLFLPHTEISKHFSELLDKFPLTPYLDSRESFMRWINFIHNHINKQLDVPELSLTYAIDSYYQHYKPKEIIHYEELKRKEKYIYGGVLTLIILACFYCYRK